MTKITHKLSWFTIGLIELLLFTRYQAHDGTIHFFIHSLAAVTVVCGIATIALLRGKQLLSHQLIYTIFLTHQFAMFPDYLYSFGIPHQPWMNIFLGHLWLDNLWHHELLLPAAAILSVCIYFATSNILSNRKL